jgi:hypothetical protein
MDDIEDPLETLNRQKGMTDFERSPARAAELIKAGYPAAYVLGANVVFDIATDSDGNQMFLTTTSDVEKLPIVNTYKDNDRIL